MVRLHAAAACRAIAAGALTLVLAAAAPAVALDVRQGDDTGSLRSDLVRAYAPCTSPNTTTNGLTNGGGLSACSPPITSPCGYREGASVTVTGIEDFVPGVGVNFQQPFGPQPPAVCLQEDYVASLLVRGSGDFTGTLLESPCPTGRCSWADVQADADMSVAHSFTPLIGPNVMADGNFELLGFTLTAPDGLPMAGFGVGNAAPRAERFVSNLTIPIPACDPDGEPCDVPPWTSPCDFSSGEVEWTLGDTNVPHAHVVLRGLAGTSPDCTAGTYVMETVVRATVRGCGGTYQHPGLCTLVDQTVTMPLEVRGGNVDLERVIQVFGFKGTYESVQIFGIRILDPTGAPFATAGVTGVSPLLSPRITIKGDALRVDAFLPAIGGTTIDPTVDPGLVVTLRDRNGPIYAGTIPVERWQLQPPLASRWDYKDKGGVLNGIRSARIKRVVKRGVQTGYRLQLEARGVDLTAADLASVTLLVDVHRFLINYDDVFRTQGTRTCRGAYPKLSCK